MKEKTFSVTNGAQLAMGTVVALLLALAALLLSTEPAEAVKGINDGGGVPADVASPYVTRTYPANNATGIPANVTLKAVFSERMKNINSGTFYIRKAGASTGSIWCSVTYQEVTTENGTLESQATCNPNDASLQPGVTYVATVTTAVEPQVGAKDLAGNPLDQDRFTAGLQPKTWTFTVYSPVICDC